MLLLVYCQSTKPRAQADIQLYMVLDSNYGISKWALMIGLMPVIYIGQKQLRVCIFL